MSEEVRLTSVEFQNFKALGHFSIKLSSLNILVGPNNCGKSTIISAFRVLEAAIRRARARFSELIGSRSRKLYGYILSEDSVPMSVENVHTDYSEEESEVSFRLSNGNRLHLMFPSDGGVILTTETLRGNTFRSPTTFMREFPVTIVTVPVLGPLEHVEEIVERDTVVRELSTHRASRHFRSYWHYFSEDFPAFAKMVNDTWPTMEIDPPDPPDYENKTISMFCREKRMTRELYWAGFGFQIWCQLLTHVTRSVGNTLLAIDEPEIYLHPDVQRQLVGILREIGPDIVLATHSSEIISEADPSEILSVDKNARSAKRLTDIGEVQEALEHIGSIQNITLTQLARNRRVIFVEDESDFIVIRKFASILGYKELAASYGLTPVKSEGFGSWERVRSLGWGIEKTLGSPLKIGAIYDRDYHCDEEVEQVVRKLKEHLQLVHVHSARKEIENYLLDPKVVQKAIQIAIGERNRETGERNKADVDAEALLDEASNEEKPGMMASYAAERAIFLRPSGIAQATVNEATIRWLDSLWPDVNARMKIVPGKTVLTRLRGIVQARYKVSLSTTRLVRSYTKDLIPEDIIALVKGLEEFRATR